MTFFKKADYRPPFFGLYTYKKLHISRSFISFCFFLPHLIIKQHPNGWCIRIIVLPGFVGPEESRQKYQSDEHTATDEEKDSAHDMFWVNCFFVAYRRVATVVNPIMVTVLNGMSIAANRGDMVPITAKLKPITLYTNDIPKLM